MALDRISRWLGLTDWTETPSGNGKAVAAVERKSGVTLSLGPNIQFVSGDGGNTISRLFGGRSSDTDHVTRASAYAASAYCYAAIRYRMRKVSEAPLMVVEEDQERGEQEWISDHPLVALLDEPSPDYDMAELVARTIAYLDLTGQALWVKDVTRGGTVGRLTPFHGDEFAVEAADDRIYGLFRLSTAAVDFARRDKEPAEVVFFQDPNPLDWWRGTSKVDVALQALNLSQQAIATTKDILRHALFPSTIIQPDAEWNPQPQEWEQFQQAVRSYADRHKRGGPLTLRGGGKATQVGLSLKDLLPSEVLRSMEAMIAGVFGIPPIVLGYQVGLENSPWSNIGEARSIAYEDGIEPEWRALESRLTRQLLWAPAQPGGKPFEADHRRLLVFDRSRIKALQKDVVMMSEVAEKQSKIASLNERRMLVGLEPVDDPRADEIPELSAPEPPPSGEFANPFAEGVPGLEEETEAARLPRLDRKSSGADVWRVFDNETKAATTQWEEPIARELEAQQQAIERMAERMLRSGKGRESKAIEEDDVEAFLLALAAFITAKAIPRLRAITYPLVFQTAKTGVEQAVLQIGITFRLVQQALTDYASRETVFLAKVMGETTGKLVTDLVQEGLEAGDTVQRLTKRLRESAAFSRDRAKLVARTETTRAWNGAQQSSLADYTERTGVGVTKTWLTAQDDRVRDEHAELEGTTLPIDGTFANGLKAPGEPNCRCTLTYALEGS